MKFVRLADVSNPNQTEVIHEIIRAVRSGELTAYDQNEKPVDWEQHKADFNEICRLVNTPGKYTHIRGNGRPREVRERSRVEVWHDEYTDNKGVKRTTPRLPYKMFLENLRDQSVQTIIPSSQYEEIKEGWGVIQKKRILKKTLFDKIELQAVLNIEDKNTPEDDKSYCEILDTMQINKQGIGKTVHMHRKQLPAAFNFCLGLLLPFIETEKLKEIGFSEKEMISMAKTAGINSTLAKDIHKNLPPMLKGKHGRPPGK